MTIKPTGEQLEINHGRYAVVVTEVGATLRSLTVDGEEVLWTFPETGTPRLCSGQQLTPWPNRIRDGRYTFDGQQQQLDITEPPRHTALHGLGRFLPWRVESRTATEVVQSAVIYPQNGWDGVLGMTIVHRLSDDGLTVRVTAENLGGNRLPYGYGAHPYVAADLATAVLTTPFRRELLVDEVRLLPGELTEVTVANDFRGGKTVGDTVLDTAFCDPETGWEVSVTTADRTVSLWADDSMRWGQVFTAPTRDGIAIEPMTCGPDAFNEGPTHDGVIILEPGESTSCEWGVRVR